MSIHLCSVCDLGNVKVNMYIYDYIYVYINMHITHDINNNHNNYNNKSIYLLSICIVCLYSCLFLGILSTLGAFGLPVMMSA